jgi:predicted O-methyltransferase YrrM
MVGGRSLHHRPGRNRRSRLGGGVGVRAAADLPAISVSPNQGKLLHLLACVHDARTILEIGTLGGYSTIWLARALPEV